jgi:hypothetical protein
MTKTLIGAVITIVIGLALLPVVGDFVDGLTGVGMTYADTTVGSLINLLPILYVLILVSGSALAVYFTSKKE